MLGVPFLDIGFMRINLAFASPTVWLIGFFCTVKGGAAAWSASRSQCRMGAPGRVRGMRRRHEPRGQTHFVLPPTPRQGGLFGFKFGNPGGSPEATRRAFNKRFLLDLAEDWQLHGREVFKRVRRESP